MPRIKREKGKGNKEEEAAEPMPETAQPPAQDEEDSPVPAAERIPVDVDPHDLDIESDPTSDSESSSASGKFFRFISLCTWWNTTVVISQCKSRGIEKGGGAKHVHIVQFACKSWIPVVPESSIDMFPPVWGYIYNIIKVNPYKN